MRKTMGMGAAAAVLLCASAGSADVLEFNIDTVFSSDQAAGHVNVKFVSFYNPVSENHEVKLTITSFLQGSEFINGGGAAQGNKGGIYLNFSSNEPATDPAWKNPSSLIFSTMAVPVGSVELDEIHLGYNGYQADGAGEYDIRIDFGKSDPDKYFNANDQVEWTISMAGIDIFASDFNHESLKVTEKDANLAAAHIQGIGPAGKGSGWHGPTLIPLPAPVYLGFAGLGLAAGVSVIKRRR